MLVCRVIIGDEIKLLAVGSSVIDQTQELDPLLMPVPLLAQADHFAAGDVHGSEHGCGAVPLVIVPHGFSASLLQRRFGLGFVQCLHLALLVHTQHNSVLGWLQAQGDNRFQLLGEVGIVA